MYVKGSQSNRKPRGIHHAYHSPLLLGPRALREKRRVDGGLLLVVVVSVFGLLRGLYPSYGCFFAFLSLLACPISTLATSARFLLHHCSIIGNRCLPFLHFFVPTHSPRIPPCYPVSV